MARHVVAPPSAGIQAISTALVRTCATVRITRRDSRPTSSVAGCASWPVKTTGDAHGMDAQPVFAPGVLINAGAEI